MLIRPGDLEAAGIDPEVVAFEGAELEFNIVLGHSVLTGGSFHGGDGEAFHVTGLRGRHATQGDLQRGIVRGPDEAFAVRPAEAIDLLRFRGGRQNFAANAGADEDGMRGLVLLRLQIRPL